MGTLDMSCSEIGAYIRLLCYQFDKGQIPLDEDKVRIICRFDGDLKAVLDKFPDGKNNTMLEVQEYLASKSKKARRSANKRWQCERNANGMLYKSKPKPKLKPKTKVKVGKEIPPSLEEVVNYCEGREKSIDPIRFFNYYESIGWLVGKAKNKMKDWKASVRSWESRNNNKTGLVDKANETLKEMGEMGL